MSTLLTPKRPDVEDGDMNLSETSWSQEHSKVFLSNPIARRNLVKYSQFHADSPTDLRQFGIGMLSYDGAASMWAKSLEELLEVFNSEEYLKTVVPDEEKFMNRSEIVTMVGWDEDKWENGKAM
ncbi:hypothetical protein ABKA04_005435 [Annulohypoxylon sp. FPYF3050]